MKNNLIVFGASGYLGKNVTKYLAQKDFYNQIFAFVKEKDAKLFDGIQRITCFAAGDFSVETAVEKAFENFSELNNSNVFLFNAIGGYSGGTSIRNTDYEIWKRMLNINLSIPFLIAKHFAKLMERNSGGSICFTSAFSSNFSDNKKTSYNTSKNALNFLIKSIALEGKELNFSANAILPNILDTPENREWIKNNKELTKIENISEAIHSLFANWTSISGSLINMNVSIG